MSEWTTSPTVVPGGENPIPPWERAFPSHANPASLHVQVGGSVELQRRDETGTWETFETVSISASQVDVANSPAIRINPIAGARYRWIWS